MAALGEHFYGHGVFSPTGDRLYATASRFESGTGIVAVYDASGDYRRLDTLVLPGIGPHELKLHPDGDTLVIALGGILFDSTNHLFAGTIILSVSYLPDYRILRGRYRRD